ncbi:uncharacterized protein LOC127096228 [Lathyrus oleraceus]|uniref:uncharacterized protein LOC127096228 n=1 Tax=Pisum sativum TaxID=3888 RepID=UPI0021D1A501|nr:uncharacterized protein LOC127096228 [Pisum sativum]
MTSLYLNPINIEPNVDASAKCPIVPNVMENVETSEKTNKPRFVTTLSKSSMIVVDRDDVDKNICVLISRSPEKYEDIEDSDGMSGDLANKEENFVEKKENIMSIDDLDSDDELVGKILAPGIAKRLKSKKDIISTTRKQTSGKKILTNIHEVPIDNIFFHFVENVEKWKFIYQRRVAMERELGKDVFECKEVMSLIQEVGLMKIVTGFSKCYEMLVKEFIINISKEYDNKRSKEFRKVYVRGRCLDFSPEIIYRFLGRNEEEQAKVEVFDNAICREIMLKHVKECPRKGKLLESYLSVKYAVLHRIGVANWVLTNNTSNIATGLGKFIYIVGTKTELDFGSYVFDQTMKHVASFTMKMPIAFPSLIGGVILSQHPSIFLSSDSICKRDPPLSLPYRLFTGKHVPDIVMTSDQKPFGSTTRARIIVDLKDTCKNLDETIKGCTERKIRLEILIKALFEEDENLKGDETGEDNANEEGTDTSGDEETTNSDED